MPHFIVQFHFFVAGVHILLHPPTSCLNTRLFSVQGAFGNVYLGLLKNGKFMAVKTMEFGEQSSQEDVCRLCKLAGVQGSAHSLLLEGSLLQARTRDIWMVSRFVSSCNMTL